MNRRILIASTAGLLTVLALTEVAQAQIYWGEGRGGRSFWGVSTPSFGFGRGPGGGEFYRIGAPYGYGYGGYGGYGWDGYGWGGRGYSPYYSRWSPGFYGGGFSRPYYGGSYAMSSPYYYSSGPSYFSSSSGLTSGGPGYVMGDTGTSGAYRTFYSGPGRTGTEALVRVNVPNAEANVWFDDTQTQQKGANRLFISPPLETGKSYSYNIRASWMGPDGQEVTRERQVDVRPGQEATVTFTTQPGDQDRDPPQPRDTDRGTGVGTDRGIGSDIDRGTDRGIGTGTDTDRGTAPPIPKPGDVTPPIPKPDDVAPPIPKP
jgi:uncharacterized protein (TIGR03000 family)